MSFVKFADTIQHGDVILLGSNSVPQSTNEDESLQQQRCVLESRLRMDRVKQVMTTSSTFVLFTETNRVFVHDMATRELKELQQFKNKHVTHASSGYLANMIVVENQYMFTAGNNYCGCLGVGNTTTEGGVSDFVEVPFFKQGQYTIEHVAVGYCHMIASCSDGSVFAWGENAYNSLGVGNTGGHQVVPTKNLLNGMGLAKLTTKGFYTFARYHNGDIWCFGHNTNCELGNGTTDSQPTPFKHEFLSSLNVVDIFGWMYGGYALTSDDQVYVWGLHGNITELMAAKSASTPIKVDLLCNKRITSMYVRNQHIFFSAPNNKCYVFGTNDSCELGFNTNKRVTSLLEAPWQDIVHGDVNGSLSALVIGRLCKPWLLWEKFHKLAPLCDMSFQFL